MSYRSKSYYWVICDVCGYDTAYLNEGLQSSQASADSVAIRHDWGLMSFDAHVCDGCIRANKGKVVDGEE